ncbi:MAG: DUF4097 family beta strand repeat protein [Spirochaetales bacterium]|nr:DUF4097 family beta strand repeat protein [Spirochaetales bacterium]
MKHTLAKVALITAAVAVVSLGIAAILFFTTNIDQGWMLKRGAEVEKRETASLDGITEIDVRSSSVDVLVGANGGDALEVKLHGMVYSDHPEAVPQLIVEKDGELLSIGTGAGKPRPFVFAIRSGDLVLEVGIPQRYRGTLVVRSRSGDVTILEQELARLSVETASGDMKLRSVSSAEASLISASGDQAIDGLEGGQLSLRSLSGGILAEDLRGAARVESSSGDIFLKYRQFDADLDVQSSSGDVELFLTDSAGFCLEARSSSGDIDCAFPLVLSASGGQMSRDAVVGIVAEGTHSVRVNTSSGDVTLGP